MMFDIQFVSLCMQIPDALITYELTCSRGWSCLSARHQSASLPWDRCASLPQRRRARGTLRQIAYNAPDIDGIRQETNQLGRCNEFQGFESRW